MNASNDSTIARARSRAASASSRPRARSSLLHRVDRLLEPLLDVSISCLRSVGLLGQRPRRPAASSASAPASICSAVGSASGGEPACGAGRLDLAVGVEGVDQPGGDRPAASCRAGGLGERLRGRRRRSAGRAGPARPASDESTSGSVLPKATAWSSFSNGDRAACRSSGWRVGQLCLA